MATDTFGNFYELLQVPPTANADQIREAIKRQRQTWQKRQNAPDPLKRVEAEAMMRELDEAHRVLLDPARRSAYDRRLPSYTPPAPARPAPASPRTWPEPPRADDRDRRLEPTHTAPRSNVRPNVEQQSEKALSIAGYSIIFWFLPLFPGVIGSVVALSKALKCRRLCRQHDIAVPKSNRTAIVVSIAPMIIFPSIAAALFAGGIR